MKGDAQGLLAVATSIADGQDVDWQTVEAGLRTDEERALLRSLRVIASIGELHRSTDSDDELPEHADPERNNPSLSLLARRGRVVGRIVPSFGDSPARPLDTAILEAAAANDWGSEDDADTDEDPGGPFVDAAPGAGLTIAETLPDNSASAAASAAAASAAAASAGIGRAAGSALDDDEPRDSAPERWGSLILRERVGAGVFGEVFRAYDEQLQREVALKLLRIGSRSHERLAAKVLHEGRLLARIRHPNVVLVHGVEVREDRVGLWMEFIRGCTLEQLLERQGLFGAREAALIGQDLCRALAAVHGAGLVHRDLKAQNVMREEGGRVVLMDFGTGVPVRDEDGIPSAVPAGTPLYLAPELLDGGEATPSSDLYSLGVLLYHLVTGGYPVTASSLVDLRGAHRRGRRRLHDARPDLPDAFVQAIDRALSPDPADRHPSAGALQEALTRALGIEMPAAAASATPAIAPTSTTADSVGVKRSATTGTASATTVGAGVGARGRTWRWLLVLGLLGIAAALAAWATRPLWRTPAPGPINSVVVLPLANVSSADRDLADGIDVLIAEQLSTLPTLRVVHYTASMASRDTGLPMSEIIRRAQADAALSGSVNWSGARAHVFLQLVRAGAGTPSWVKQLDVPSRRAAELPRSVAREVAGALGLQNLSTSDLGTAAQGASTPEAFEAYLRARVHMRAATVPAVKQAIEQLQDALRLDPQHAPSLAALADCYIVQAISHRVRPFEEAGRLAREAAERALQLDNQLPEAHQALAEIRFYIDWDWAGAEQAFKRALEFRPNAGALRTRYAMFLASRKRLPDAMQEVHQAVALDPMSPVANAALGMLWHYARSDDQAERIYRGVLEDDPVSYPARVGLIRTYLRTRRFDLALKELERTKAEVGGELSAPQLSLFGIAYAGLGRTADAIEIAERLVAQEAGIPSVEAASVFIAIDQRDRALGILEEAVAQKSPKVLFLRLDPRFDPLLNEPRFREILRRMGFPS